MRGKVFSVCIGITNVRITPAYAGKRSISRSNLPLKRDHPRLCGEKIYFRSNLPLKRDHPRLCGEKLISLHKSSSERGSPPPMRGKVFFNDFSHGLLRITPAYAGKSQTASPCTCSTRDHPRLCGEKHQLGENSHQNQGSPPPMRGKGSKRNIIFPVVRITPAYAGKSSTAPEIRL